MNQQAKHLRAVPSATPVGGCYDPRFVYVPAVATDIRETFRRVIAERAANKRFPL